MLQMLEATYLDNGDLDKRESSCKSKNLTCCQSEAQEQPLDRPQEQLQMVIEEEKPTWYLPVASRWSMTTWLISSPASCLPNTEYNIITLAQQQCKYQHVITILYWDDFDSDPTWEAPRLDNFSRVREKTKTKNLGFFQELSRGT